MAQGSKNAVVRDAHGRVISGTPNPGGRSKAFAEFRAAVEKLSPRAVEVLAELLEHDDGKVRVQAVREVLDRSWGKAAQPITGEDGKPVSIDLAPLLAKLVG